MFRLFYDVKHLCVVLCTFLSRRSLIEIVSFVFYGFFNLGVQCMRSSFFIYIVLHCTHSEYFVHYLPETIKLQNELTNDWKTSVYESLYVIQLHQ